VEGIYTALRKTKSIAIYQTATKTLMLICIIFPVIVLKGSYKAAIIGWGVASFLTFIIAMVMKNMPYVKISEELVPKMYKTIFNYSLPLMGASLVGMVLHSADQFFISRYYGQVTFAEFSNGFIQIPFIGMIAGSVRSVLLPLFSKAESEGTMEEAFGVYRRAVIKSINLVYPLIVFSFFFSSDIVVLLYGEQYEVSKSYLQVSLLRSIADVFPYLSVLLALGKSNVYFNVHLIFALLIWLVDFLIVKLQWPPIAIALSSSLIHVLIAASIFTYLKVIHSITLIPRFIIKRIAIIGLHLSTIAAILLVLRNQCLFSASSYLALTITGVVYYLLLILTGKFIKNDYATELIIRVKRFIMKDEH
jgi:O-antigen/teichoic acid export membrane protein